MTIAPDEETVLARFQNLRWKTGLRCPRCGGARCTLHARGRNGRRKLRCEGCGRTFTDLTGTPLAHTHLSLGLWAAAARMMAAGRPTCSELALRLDVKLATAWRMRKILTTALQDEDLRQALVQEDTP
ncbi:MAG: transposase [Elusimicrobia bacterium]|nr:transposase [Elusimicrobiota bacterium]